MVSVIQALFTPGARKPITKTARTASPESKSAQAAEREVEGQQQPQSASTKYNVFDEEKQKFLDRCLDNVVTASGSTSVLFLIVALVLLWALIGIRFGQSENWQVLISDVQALLCYVLDSLLMRQQLNAYNREMRIAAVMQSRSVTVRRMLRQIKRSRLTSKTPALRPVPNQTALPIDVRHPSRINRIVDMLCDFLGHVVTMTFFWICIFVWLGLGPYCGWSVRWQLYINSATSALMILVFALLTSIREQHKRQTSAYLRQVCELDICLESQLRQLVDYKIPNESFTIYPGTVGRLERAISYYADLVGTLVGICILASVVVIWIVIGPALHFSSNWWLIIGTYAGLIGMHDGFVLHNVQSQLNRHSQAALADVVKEDLEALAIISPVALRNSSVPSAGPENRIQPEIAPADLSETARPTRSSMTNHTSTRLSRLMSHPAAVIVGIIFILALLVAASALGWSTTGQLVCNIPPSIVETFVMMALITREKLDWDEEGHVWQAIGEKRVAVLDWLKTLAQEMAEKDVEVAEVAGEEKDGSTVEELSQTPHEEGDNVEVTEIVLKGRE